MQINIPPKAALVLDRLGAAGYPAYVVGGCVRDSLMGRAPKDWDVATAATPDQIKAALAGWRLLDTGIQHGTVTVLLEGMPIEVTSFRLEGEYLDFRRPAGVEFTTDLHADLARRDFTINAIAYNPKEGLVDPFGGREDIEKKQIRCVGEPDRRFGEDGLRIMRGLRLASELGFSIEEDTAKSLLTNRHILTHIAPERLSAELLRLICGQDFARVLRDYHSVLSVVIPELAEMLGFDQQTPYHLYDVYEHTIQAMGLVEPSPLLRLTMLLHDVGKPRCFSLDHKGIGHFYGHAKLGSRMAEEILRRLRFDNKTTRQVCCLITHHYSKLSAQPVVIKGYLREMGEERFRLLLKVRAADDQAKSPLAAKTSVDTAAIEAALDVILAEDQCYSLGQLAIKGTELSEMGVAGREIGRLLSQLLDEVIEGNLPNDRAALARRARELTEEKRRSI